MRTRVTVSLNVRLTRRLYNLNSALHLHCRARASIPFKSQASLRDANWNFRQWSNHSDDMAHSHLYFQPLPVNALGMFTLFSTSCNKRLFRKPFIFASQSLTTTYRVLSSTRTSSSWLASLPCCLRQSSSSTIRQTYRHWCCCASSFTPPKTSKRARSKCSKFLTGHCTDQRAILLLTSSPVGFSIKSLFNMKNASSGTWLGEWRHSPVN